MATLQNPYSRMNPTLGTKQPESIGASLAGLVSTSLKAYGQVKEIDKKYDEEQDEKMAEIEQIAYNDKLKQFRDDDVNNKSETMSSKEYASYKSKHRAELEQLVSNFKSKWSKKRSSDLVKPFDNAIAKSNLKYQTELQEDFKSTQISNFVNNPTFNNDEFENVFKIISGFKTGVNYSKEDYVNDIASSMSSKYSGIASKLKNGELDNGKLDLDSLKNVKNNILSYVKDEKLKAIMENSYSQLLSQHRKINENKLDEENVELLYGDKSLTYTNAHKRLYKKIIDMDDDEISSNYKNRIINKITNIKEATLKKGSTGNKSLVKYINDIAKNTYGNGKYILEKAIELNDESLEKTARAKIYVEKLLSDGNYTELNIKKSANGVFEVDGKLYPYSSELINNQIKLYMQGLETDMSNLKADDEDYDTNFQVNAAQVKKLEETMDGVKSSIGNKAQGIFENTQVPFTSEKEVNDMLLFMDSYKNKNDKDSGQMRYVSNIIDNQLATLKKQYGDDNNKLLTAINRVKNNAIKNYKANISIPDEKLEDFGILTVGKDITEDTFRENFHYMSDKYFKNHPTEIGQPLSEDLLESMREETTTTWTKDFGQRVKGMFFESESAILLPKGNKVFERFMNKHVGTSFEYQGKTYTIGDQDLINVRIIDYDRIQILDKDTQALILDLNIGLANRLNIQQRKNKD